MLIILSILVLSVYTAFVDIIDKDNHSTYIFARLTTGGWIYIILVIVVIALNIYVQYIDDKESSERDLDLKKIKEALDKQGLKYDSTSHKINTQI